MWGQPPPAVRGPQARSVLASGLAHQNRQPTTLASYTSNQTQVRKVQSIATPIARHQPVGLQQCV
jgi:hypothetical protein